MNPCTGKVPPSNPPDELLDGFNYMNCLRRAHGVPDLKWNKTLADGAQEWASSCPQGHGDGAISEFLRSYGENMVCVRLQAGPLDSVGLITVCSACIAGVHACVA